MPGAEVGRISATDADLGDNAKLEYTILDGESGDTFNITGANQEAVIILNKVGRTLTGHMVKGNPAEKMILKRAYLFLNAHFNCVLEATSQHSHRKSGQKLYCWLSAKYGYSQPGCRPACSFCLKKESLAG